MRFRKIKYRFMNGKKLVNLAEENCKKLKGAIGFEEMFEIFDDNYDIIVALLQKGRHDIYFINYIKENLDRLLIKQD